MKYLLFHYVGPVGGGVRLAQQLHCGWGPLHPPLECLRLSPGFALHSSFLLMCSVGGSNDGSASWDPAAHLGNPARLNSCFLALGWLSTGYLGKE